MKKVTRLLPPEPQPEPQPEPAAKRTRYVQPELLPTFEKILEPHRAAILPAETQALLLDIQSRIETLDVQLLEASHDPVRKRWKAAQAAAIADPSQANLEAAGSDRETWLAEAGARKNIVRELRANLLKEFAPIIAAIIAAAVSILEAELAVFEKHDRNLAELLSLPFQISPTLNAAFFGVERMRQERVNATQSPRSALRGIIAL